MEYLCEINNRKIYYLSYYTSNWEEELPDSSWMCVPIGNERDIEKYIEISEKCILKDVIYTNSIGLECELIHDIFDETIIEFEIDNRVNPKNGEKLLLSFLTSWDNNFDEGIWFAIFQSSYDDYLIDTIVILDSTIEGEKLKVKNTLDLIISGWEPYWD